MLNTTTIFILQCVGYNFTLDIAEKIFNSFNSFRILDSDKKLYVTTNINKSLVLMCICYIFLIGLYKNPRQLLNNTDIPTNEIYIWNRVTACYAMTDLVGLLRSKKMPLSTQIHHIGVVIAYGIIMKSDINSRNMAKSLCLYGAFSSIAFLVNIYLGVRKLTDKTKTLKKCAGLSYILACSINWSWQLYYQLNYFNPLTFKTLLYSVCSSGLLYSWIQDDVKLIKHLIK